MSLSTARPASNLPALAGTASSLTVSARNNVAPGYGKPDEVRPPSSPLSRPTPCHPLQAALQAELRKAQAASQSSEARKTFFVVQGPHVPSDLVGRLEQTLNAQGETVRLPSGALHRDAYRLSDVEDTATARQLVKAMLARERVDSGFVPGDRTIDRVRLAMYDMDGTLIQDDSAAKLRDLVPGAAEVEMVLRAKRDRLGLSIFDENSKRERTRLFKGLPEEEVLRCVEDVLSRMTPGAETMFDAFKPFAKQFVASGGFTHFTKALVERHGLDGQQAIGLEVGNEQGRRVLTGEIESGTVDPRAKAQWLEQLSADVPPDSIIFADGDGLNDREMFRVAQERGGLAVAYHAYRAGNKNADIDSPDSVVEQAADIKIRHTGQDGVPNFFLPAST